MQSKEEKRKAHVFEGVSMATSSPTSLLPILVVSRPTNVVVVCPTKVVVFSTKER